MPQTKRCWSVAGCSIRLSASSLAGNISVILWAYNAVNNPDSYSVCHIGVFNKLDVRTGVQFSELN